jgi:hypothetical protein
MGWAFFIGLATAEFLPADPATWCDAGGWLYGTPGGEEALAAWMDGRGIKIAVLS